ncbi:hypothetical protein ACP70R_042702 [Stipagrostis hirtigluma subsp. patula]
MMEQKMVETVISLASSLVGNAISKATSVAANEMSLLLGVRKETWFIKDELKTIQAFLMAADAKDKKDKLLKVWVEQVRDLSYDIEDCLDQFMVHVRCQSLSQQLMKLKDRHRIAAQIRDLKSRVEEVSNRNKRYELINASIDKQDFYVDDVRNLLGKNMEEAGFVGFDNPKKELLELIDIPNQVHDKVIFVEGMGGSGKTTLVWNVFRSIDISKNFSCALVTVSQSLDRKELLQDLIKQLLGDGLLKEHTRELQSKPLSELQSKKVDEHQLVADLRKGLEKLRYFVVVDDLWDIVHWNWIKTTVFSESNMKGCRLVVTTRNANIAKQCTSLNPIVYPLKVLTEDHAKELLLKKAKKTREDLKRGNVEDIFEKIVKKCAGLPLAIVTIGGVLVSKHVDEWEKVYQQLPSELENNQDLETMKRVVALSYTHLPSHLKPCFLYLSIFPEDSKIKRRCLVNRWIAEGFVAPRTGMTLEDVGNSYFDDLINRSMIEPHRHFSFGEVQTCIVHDIMHDITISISREENFLLWTKDYVSGIAPNNIRHLSINVEGELDPSFDLRHVRSLSVFDRPNVPLASLCSPQLEMLRVLDLEQSLYSVTQKDIRNISLFRHLKYLYVGSESYIYALPRSIGKLQGLQILDVRQSLITKLPIEVTKLRCLRSLRCSNIGCYDKVQDPRRSIVRMMKLPLLLQHFVDSETRAQVVAELHSGFSSCWSSSEGVRIPKGIGSLKALQILEVVDIGRSSKKAVRELGKLTQLRKLAVAGVGKRNFDELCEALQKLPSLLSLSVDVDAKSNFPQEALDQLYSPSLLKLRSLKFGGAVAKMPNWVGQLNKLVKIQLWSTNLKELEFLRMLGKLPKLACVRLLWDSYLGEKLVFQREAFQELRTLEIMYLEKLRKVTFEEGTSPKLEKITIAECSSDITVRGTNSLKKLKEISHYKGGTPVNLNMPQKPVGGQSSSSTSACLKDQIGQKIISEWIRQPAKVNARRTDTSYFQP